MESPSFERMKQERREERMPLLAVLRQHPRELLVGMGMRVGQNTVFYIYTVFVLSYGASTLHYPPHHDARAAWRSPRASGSSRFRSGAISRTGGDGARSTWPARSSRSRYAFPFFWLLGLGSSRS